MTTYWARVALIDGQAVVNSRITQDGGIITKVESGVEPLGQDVVLEGVVCAGFANAHSHAFHRLLRSHVQRERGSFWTWREQMYEAASLLNPDTYYDAAQRIYREMLGAGITCVGEFHYVHHNVDGTPYGEPNAMGQALINAASDVGIRITLLDTFYEHGGLSETGHVKPLERQVRFVDKSVEHWYERVGLLSQSLDSSKSKLGAAIHSMRAVGSASAAKMALLCNDNDWMLHIHVSEQTTENEQVEAFYKMTPTQLLDQSGVLGPNATLVHATHLTETDIELIAKTKTGVCFCPTTERDLADGVGPSSELVRRGVKISFGSDSHAVIDINEEAKALEMNQRLVTNVRGHHSAAEMLEMATVNGHQQLGWTDAGSIAVGSRCDLVCFATDTPRMWGSEKSPLEAVMFAATSSDICDVVVDGRHLIVRGSK